MPLVFALKEMEENGIAINSENLKSYSKTLSKDQELEEKIKTLAGEDFNIDSPNNLEKSYLQNFKLTSKQNKVWTICTSENVLLKLKKNTLLLNLY